MDRRRWLAVAVALLGGAIARQAFAAPPPSRFRGRRIDIELQDVDIHRALEIFAEVGKVNIVPEQGIAGRVTLKMTDQPWDYCLCLVLESLGLEMQRDGNVIYVCKPK